MLFYLFVISNDISRLYITLLTLLVNSVKSNYNFTYNSQLDQQKVSLDTKCIYKFMNLKGLIGVQKSIIVEWGVCFKTRILE